jgi:hypothetical protein
MRAALPAHQYWSADVFEIHSCSDAGDRSGAGLAVGSRAGGVGTGIARAAKGRHRSCEQGGRAGTSRCDPEGRRGRCGPKTTKTREQRKAETDEAKKAGQLATAGSTQKADVADAARKPTKTREQRKAETEEARKKGELTPAGEGGPTK